MNLSLLSQTFRDAITITRQLNIRYLWIDSLCIIQDDLRDWEFESANMSSIYRSSILTIAAAATVDSVGGCFAATPKLGSKYIWEIVPLWDQKSRNLEMDKAAQLTGDQSHNSFGPASQSFPGEAPSVYNMWDEMAYGNEAGEAKIDGAKGQSWNVEFAGRCTAIFDPSNVNKVVLHSLRKGEEASNP